MLHVPVGAGSFCLMTPSYGTTRPAPGLGTTVTPGTASEGSWATVQSALAQDAYGIMVCINSAFTSATPRNYVVDIGADPAGGTSYSAIITDLLAGGATALDVGGGVWYYFPLFIPAGSTIGARAQGTNASTMKVFTSCFQLPMNPSQVRKGSFTETVGITPGAILGTSVTPGTSSEGSWTSIGTTVNRLWWWQLGVQVSASDSAWNTALLFGDVATGDATHKDIIIQDNPFVTSTAEACANPPLSAGVEWDVPAGANIYVRLQNAGSNDTYTVAVYGCGG